MENKKGRGVLLKDSLRGPKRWQMSGDPAVEEGPPGGVGAGSSARPLPTPLSPSSSGLLCPGGKMSGPGTCYNLGQRTAVVVTDLCQLQPNSCTL